MFQTNNTQLWFTIPAIILSGGFFVYSQSLLSLGIVLAFVALMIVEKIVEGKNNQKVLDQIEEVRLLLKSADKVVDKTTDDLEYKITQFDREFDERIDYFARATNAILGNMNSVTVGIGYGEQLKKVSKKNLKKGGNDGSDDGQA